MTPRRTRSATVYGGSDFVFEVKLEPVDDSPAGGDPYSSPDGTISGTIVLDVNEGAKTFNYTITGSGAAVGVIVKGGPDGNWYDYIGESSVGFTDIGPQTSDINLHAPRRNDGLFGLSHISFCMVQAQADPTIETTLTEVGTTNSDEEITVTIGASVTDTATLSGATADAGGDIDFQVFGPDDADCSGDPVFEDLDNPVMGNGDYTSDAFSASEVGTYNWVVTYSGDTNNNGATSACGVDVLTVAQNQPDLATAPWVYPNDSAEISGLVDPQSGSTLVFTAYTDADCAGTVLFTETFMDIVDGAYDTTNTSVEVSTDSTVFWVVEYSGDANNAGAVSDCVEEIQLTFVSDPA